MTISKKRVCFLSALSVLLSGSMMVAPAVNFPAADGIGDDSGNKGDPINLLSGAVWALQTDIAIPCPGFDLMLRRTYQTKQGEAPDSSFGSGWAHSLNPCLSFKYTHGYSTVEIGGCTSNNIPVGYHSVWFYPGDGSSVLVHLSKYQRPLVGSVVGGGAIGYDPISFTPLPLLPGDLPQPLDPDIEYTEIVPNVSYRLEFPGLSRIDFTKSGSYAVATRFWNAAGQSITLERDEAMRLTRAAHSCGQSIEFEYDSVFFVAPLPCQRS